MKKVVNYVRMNLVTSLILNALILIVSSNVYGAKTVQLKTGVMNPEGSPIEIVSYESKSSTYSQGGVGIADNYKKYIR